MDAMQQILFLVYFVGASFLLYTLLFSKKFLQTRNKRVQSSLSQFRAFFSQSVLDLYRRKGATLLYAIPLFLIFPLLDGLKGMNLPDYLFLFLSLLLIGMAIILLGLIIKTLFFEKRSIFRF